MGEDVQMRGTRLAAGVQWKSMARKDQAKGAGGAGLQVMGHLRPRPTYPALSCRQGLACAVLWYSTCHFLCPEENSNASPNSGISCAPLYCCPEDILEHPVNVFITFIALLSENVLFHVLPWRAGSLFAALLYFECQE